LVRPSSCVDERVSRSSLGCSGVLSLPCSTITFLSLFFLARLLCLLAVPLCAPLHEVGIAYAGLASPPSVPESLTHALRSEAYSPKDNRRSSHPDPDVEQQDEPQREVHPFRSFCERSHSFAPFFF